MLAKDIKPGALVVVDDQPCLVKSVTLQSPSARGKSMIYKYRGLNLISKQKVDFSLRGGESLREADFERRAVKLMYRDTEAVHLLDQGDYNQYSLPLADVADEVAYLTEETDGANVLIYNGEPVGLDVPLTVDLRVTDCDPAVRGDSATSRTKSATLETGLVIQVPEYLASGETVRVDTRTGKFVARA